MSRNIVWHESTISREDRENLLNQKGLLLWFTGLSGSGKSTVANELQKKLYENNNLTYLLDGDNIRHGLCSDLGFSLEDREENIRRITEVSRLFVDSGIITLATFVSPLINDRKNVRKLLGEDFIEIYIKCDIKTCEERDPKKLYEKARQGEIKNFTGIDSPYEAPTDAEIVIDTDKLDVDEAVSVIIKYLNSRGLKL